jgi:hypothetical protein
MRRTYPRQLSCQHSCRLYCSMFCVPVCEHCADRWAKNSSYSVDHVAFAAFWFHITCYWFAWIYRAADCVSCMTPAVRTIYWLFLVDSLEAAALCKCMRVDSAAYGFYRRSCKKKNCWALYVVGFVFVLLPDDVLKEDKGECVICLDDLCQGDTIARLPCLCIYHKRYLLLIHDDTNSVLFRSYVLTSQHASYTMLCNLRALNPMQSRLSDWLLAWIWLIVTTPWSLVMYVRGFGLLVAEKKIVNSGVVHF